jgi:hypothetical protein
MSDPYNETVFFEFELERLFDPKTQVFSNSLEESEDVEFKTIKLKVEGRSYYHPGQYYGPPEYCYPSESDTEILSVENENGEDWLDKLTEPEVQSLLEEIEDRAQS